MSKQPPLQIWTVTDGTAGMRFQAIALAEAICAERSNATHSDYIAPPHRLLRSLPQWGRACSWLPLFAATPASAPPNTTFPDILITCGRRMAGVSIAMRERARRAGAAMQTVHLQDPRLSPTLFDVLVVPSPTWLCVFLPQQRPTPSMVVAQALTAPMWTFLNLRPPTTAVGTLRWVVVPSPSWASTL